MRQVRATNSDRGACWRRSSVFSGSISGRPDVCVSRWWMVTAPRSPPRKSGRNFVTVSVSASSCRSRSHNTADAVIGLVGDASKNGRSTRAAPKARESSWPAWRTWSTAAATSPLSVCARINRLASSKRRGEIGLLRGERAFPRPSRRSCPWRRWPLRGSGGASCESSSAEARTAMCSEIFSGPTAHRKVAARVSSFAKVLTLPPAG